MSAYSRSLEGKNPLPKSAAGITHGAMKLGFVGSGKMATALVSGAAGSGAFAREDILVCDTVPGVAERLAAGAKVTAVAGSADLAAQVDVLVLCVKPNDALEALRSLGAAAAGKLIISIVAGLPIAA